jgi:hypothetical protein
MLSATPLSAVSIARSTKVNRRHKTHLACSAFTASADPNALAVAP